MKALFQQFIDERRYLKGVSPATVEWYRYSFLAFERRCDEITKPKLRSPVVDMVKSGLSACSVNDYIRCMNAFLVWAKEEGHISTSFKLEKLQTERKVIQTLSPEQIKRLIQFKPNARFKRTHTACLILLDTGLRISELLNLRKVRIPGKAIRVPG